jgi:hypothetical protein
LIIIRESQSSSHATTHAHNHISKTINHISFPKPNKKKFNERKLPKKQSFVIITYGGEKER